MTMKAEADAQREVDMSPAAIDRRLRDLQQLYKLGMSLKSARRVGKASELESSGDSAESVEDDD